MIIENYRRQNYFTLMIARKTNVIKDFSSYLVCIHFFSFFYLEVRHQCIIAIYSFKKKVFLLCDCHYEVLQSIVKSV